MKILKSLMAIVLAMTLVACQSTNGDKPSGSTVSYPMTITDQVGREVTIEKEPEKIISGYYISSSLLIALGEDKNMVGIENKAKSRNIYKLSASHLIDLPAVGTAKQFDLEGAIKLNPDLVILPYKLKDIAPNLEQLGIDVIYVQPETQESLEEMITLLGKVTDNTEKADKLLNFIHDEVDAMKKLVKSAKKPTVYMAGNSSLLSTAGPKMYQHTLIENAGGVNVANDLVDSYWSEIDYEKLLTYNPDYIILASDATYTVDSVLNDPQLKDCKAVVNKNVYQFPSDVESWDSPIPASVLGNLWLASTIHNDLYSTADYEKSFVEFYQTFYGFNAKK